MFLLKIVKFSILNLSFHPSGVFSPGSPAPSGQGLGRAPSAFKTAQPFILKSVHPYKEVSKIVHSSYVPFAQLPQTLTSYITRVENRKSLMQAFPDLHADPGPRSPLHVRCPLGPEPSLEHALRLRPGRQPPRPGSPGATRGEVPGPPPLPQPTLVVLLPAGGSWPRA